MGATLDRAPGTPAADRALRMPATAATATATTDPTPRTPAAAVAIAAACLLGAEGIHTAVIAEHFAEWWAEGVFFLGLAVLEGALAVALLLGPVRPASRAAILASVGTIAVWAWSRTTGLPIGPEAGYPEAVGRADVVATVLEAATAIALAPVAVRAATTMRPPRARMGPRVTAAAVAAIALTTAFGLAGPDDHAAHAGHAAPAPINVAAEPGHR